MISGLYDCVEKSVFQKDHLTFNNKFNLCANVLDVTP